MWEAESREFNPLVTGLELASYRIRGLSLQTYIDRGVSGKNNEMIENPKSSVGIIIRGVGSNDVVKAEVFALDKKGDVIKNLVLKK